MTPALTPPLPGLLRVTSLMGDPRAWGPHSGIDLASEDGSVHRMPILAPEPMTVIQRWEDEWPFGNALLCDGATGIWRNLHFAETPAAQIGYHFEQGETIGLVDNTGASKGSHLHHDIEINGTHVNPLHVYARSYALAHGYDPDVFHRQINHESGWNPWWGHHPRYPANSAGAKGIAQIITRWHPAMEGRTMDPFASLDYAAALMASHLERRGGNYREALADYNAGPNSDELTHPPRSDGYRYADAILKGVDVGGEVEEMLRAELKRVNARKDSALHQVGELVGVVRRSHHRDDQDATRNYDRPISDDDWGHAMAAETFFHDPEATAT